MKAWAKILTMNDLGPSQDFDSKAMMLILVSFWVSAVSDIKKY